MQILFLVDSKTVTDKKKLVDLNIMKKIKHERNKTFGRDSNLNFIIFGCPLRKLPFTSAFPGKKKSIAGCLETF